MLGNDVTLTGTASLDASGTSGGGTVLVGGDWQGKNAAVPNAQYATMEAGAVIKADATDKGNGGKVVLWAEDTTDFKGHIFARGGANGGDGGRVETSGRQHLGLGGTVNTLAPRGAIGSWLIDPDKLCIDDTGYCNNSTNLYSPYRYGGSTADIWSTADLTSNVLSQASSTNITLYAGDYLAFLPNGGTWTVPSGIPSGRAFYIDAPHLYLNGTVDFRANGVRMDTLWSTLGRTSSSLPTMSDTIVFDSGARMLLPAGVAGEYAFHDFHASTIAIKAGAQIDAPYSVGTDSLGYGYYYGDDVRFQADDLLKTAGGSVKARRVSFVLGLNGGDAELDVTGGRVSVDTDDLDISVHDNDGFKIGTETCEVQGCWGDLNNYLGGTWKTLSFSLFGTGNLSIVGNFNPGSAASVFLTAPEGNMSVDAPISTGSYYLNLRANDITVNASISAAEAVNIDAVNALTINAPLTGTATNYGFYLHGTDVYLNSDMTVASHAHVDAGNSLSIGTGLFKGTGSYSNFSFTAPTISNAGATVSSSGLQLAMDAFTGSPLVLQLGRWVTLGPRMQKTAYLGTSLCPTGAWCLNDVGSLVSGSYKSLHVYTWGRYGTEAASGGDLHVVGDFKSAASENLTLDADGTLYVDVPMSLGDVSLRLWGNNGVHVDKAVTAEHIGIGTGPNADILLNAKITATGTDFTYYSPTTAGGEKTSRHPAVDLYLGCEYNSSTSECSSTTGKFINTAGADAISIADGTAWILSAPQGATVDLGGLAAKTYTQSELQALGYSVYYASSGGTFYANVKSEAPPPPAAPDPCVLNPTLCASNPSPISPSETDPTSVTPSTGTTTGGSTLSAPLTIDAKLTVADSGTTSSSTESSTTTVTQTTSTPLEARLTVGKQDSDKSASEVRAEAVKAKEDSVRAEAEARKAETEAKQAAAEAKEAEAATKSAKTPAAKAAAKEKAEAKKAEAEAKQAEAEAKKAEAEAKQAEAESREALAEAKSAPTEAAGAASVEKSQAEAKQAQAEAKQAEAEARKAEAESKQATIEAKAAKTPDQKAVAQKTAEAKKTEAEAKKTEAEAKAIEAEAKQAEVDAKTAQTPEARAAAEKRAENKQAEAEVKKTEAESKQAQAEGKQAEVEGKKAEVRAKEAQAEAKQAEAEAKAAKAPEEKLAAAQKAEVKKTEAEAHKAESEARKVEAEGKKIESEAKQAEAEVKKAEAEAKQATAPEQKAAAEKKVEAKRVEAEVKKTEAESKQAQAEGKQAEAEGKQAEVRAKEAQAEAKQAEAEAKTAKAPEEKLAAVQKAEVKKTEAEAHKAESEARKVEAEGKKIEAEAKQAEAEVKKAEAEVKQAKAPEQKATAEKKAETKRVEAEVKKTEAESKQAQAEGKQAEAEGKQAEVRAKEAQAEAKQAEAEAKTAKAPEEKLAAVQKAEVKKTEAEAHKTASEAKQTAAEGKKIEAEAKKAEAEVKKAEAEVKQAKAPEQKAAAAAKAETKRVEAEVKKAEAAAKQTEAEAKQAQSEAKMAEADAKGMRSPGGRAVAEKQAESKHAEAAVKKAEAEVKKAEAEVKKAEAVVKKAEAEGKKAEAELKKAEAEVKKAEVQAKRAEAEGKRIEAEKKAEAHRLAVEKRKEERRAESAKAFAAVSTTGASRASLQHLVALRHELKTEALKPALSILKADPKAADLPPCGAGSSVCVPVVPQAAVNLPPPPVPTVSFLPQIQRKVAVVVGVNKYADPAIPSLETALPDAQAVGNQLKEQLGYDVRVLSDASRADIVNSLNKLSQEVGPNDSVTVYYAGHGYLNEDTKAGYWIPADAKVTNPANWISNNDIAKLLANIPAKQVMLVSDSCYSGSLAKEQKLTAGAGSLDPTGILAKRSVTVMSSGGEEPVSDEGKDGHSIFAYSFMSALKSVKEFDSGARLFDTVRSEVSKEFPQTPQYGGALSAGHTSGGDYLFEARSYR